MTIISIYYSSLHLGFWLLKEKSSRQICTGMNTTTELQNHMHAHFFIFLGKQVKKAVPYCLLSSPVEPRRLAKLVVVLQPKTIHPSDH
jgi:hypothetical protein